MHDPKPCTVDLQLGFVMEGLRSISLTKEITSLLLLNLRFKPSAETEISSRSVPGTAGERLAPMPPGLHGRPPGGKPYAIRPKNRHIGAVVIRLGFWGLLYYNCDKEPPK